jgi:cytochrome c556
MCLGGATSCTCRAVPMKNLKREADLKQLQEAMSGLAAAAAGRRRFCACV